MSPETLERWVLACWISAGLLFLLELGLSAALNAISSLSRVALRRIGGEHPELDFVPRLREPVSEHRTATFLLRQLALLGGSLLIVAGALLSGWRMPVVAGIGVGTLVGVLLVEALVARPLALWEPRGTLRATRWLMRLARALLYPLVGPLNRLYSRLDRADGFTEDDPDDDPDEHVEALIEAGEREGLLEAAEGKMMRRVADLDETRVREIMTPRIDIEAVSEASTVREARRRLIEAGHSRLPVYRETIDNVVGVLHARDLFRAWESGQEDAPIGPLMRAVIHVTEHLSAADLLAQLRTTTKIAMVVDEFGGVCGLVTLEDVLEEIVGDIRDEHEQEEVDSLRRESDGSWTVQGVTHVEELEQLFDVDFGERDFDTVGGLVVTACGRVPRVGEAVEVGGLRIEIVAADRRRILRVRVRPQAPDDQQALP